MPSADLYIIAAGNGSRINVDIPKALIPINVEPCLTSSVRRIGPKFERIFVVTNELASNLWCNYFRSLHLAYPEISKRVVNIPIKSGIGDGHAALQGLLDAERRNLVSDEVILTWGDVYFPHTEIVDELLSARIEGSGLLPAVLETDPYVTLVVNERMQCLSADFAKHGETNVTGLHDQSLFRFVRARLRGSLCSLHNALWKNGRYITQTGELALLHSIHQLYNIGDPAYAYETRYATLSFNTAAEVDAIRASLGHVATDSPSPQQQCGSSLATYRSVV